ncbi:MAG TPA: restriction endonuclease [Aliidongia sp.]|nr:restriction endonuclease [Aliidongia sp.]
MTSGAPQRPDSVLEAEIVRVQKAIQVWAEAHDLWFDCSFKSYLRHVNGEPSDPPIVTLLICEGGLYPVLGGEDPEGHEEEFRALLDKLGYFYEKIDGVTVAIYPEDPSLSSAFADYFHWQWVCSLIMEDTADVYHELYDHFTRRPEDLNRLHWRDFEILLSRIFQNQGFETELGPGRNDGGVDLRLWQRDPIGDILTLVQAKRYAVGNKIDLTQVAALYGVSAVEGADKALFVTTSSYAPAAQRFAVRTSGLVELAERCDIVEWCARATAGIIADKSSLVSPTSVSRIIVEVTGRKDPRILTTSYGYNRVLNDFALVIKETKHAALLMRLPNSTISDDGYGQRGLEVPQLDGTTISRLRSDLVWRTKRKVHDGRVSYWDGSHLFHAWDGEPRPFDLMD